MPIKSVTRENLIKLEKKVQQFVRLVVDFERNFQIHLYCVGMVWRDRFRPEFLFKYRRVAKKINFERLWWFLNVFFKSTLTVLVWCGGVGFDPFFVKILQGG